MDPDRGLVEEAARGSREAFDEIVRRYQGQIINLARALTSSDSDADDLAQEAFIRVWRNMASFRFESTFKTWLYGVAINVIRTGRRRRLRLRRLFWSPPTRTDDAGPLERAAVDNDIEVTVAMRQAIDRALETLPDDMREAIVLRDVQGLEYREIADALGVPIGTVEWRIFRARKRLKPLLEPLRNRRT